MQKRQFRIGELAQQLAVEKFVIRFWEKEFGMPATRSQGGQRFYSEDDLQRFQQIKTLLYEQGFTIAGAKKHLSGQVPTAIIASRKTTLEEVAHAPKVLPDAIAQQLKSLKIHLKRLHDLL